MNNTMPEEQIEFMNNISNHMKESTNMSKEEANDFAFRVWQNERFFKELFGYNKAIDDAVNEIVSTKSEVAEKEHYDDHLFTVLAQRQNEIIDLIKKLKGGEKNEID